MVHARSPDGGNGKPSKQQAPQNMKRDAGSGGGGTSKKQEKKRRREDASSLEKGNSTTTSQADFAHRPSKKRKGNLSAGDNVIDLTSNLDHTSIVNDEPELPVEIGTLKASYDVTEMNIISSSKMEAKVTKVLETLAKFSFVAPCKPNIIYLHAKAPCASKLISILEIAKRTISEKKGKWYQYNQLGEVKEERKREAGKTIKDAMAIDEEITADSTDFRFETMKTPFERATEGTPKVRAVPVLGIYLSRVRVESLKKQYGEQTNALK